jgi:endoplasmic reticulum-Golgi intermediate compartment protein 3
MDASGGLRQRRRDGGDGGDGGDGKGGKSKGKLSLESFDLYQKAQATEQVQTTSGATVTLVSLAVIVLLLLGELSGLVWPKRQEHVVVDPEVEGRLRINFDITFHALSCAEANLDAMDVAGEQQNGIDHDITKTRLDGTTGLPVADSFAVRIEGKAGNGTGEGAAGQHDDADHPAEPTPLPADYCGSCYGAVRGDGNACCNTCEDLRRAYAEKGWDSADVARGSEQCIREHKNPLSQGKEGEGCRIAGFMFVNKVAGNFHIAMGETHARGAGHIHQFNPAAVTK